MKGQSWHLLSDPCGDGFHQDEMWIMTKVEIKYQHPSMFHDVITFCLITLMLMVLSSLILTTLPQSHYIINTALDFVSANQISFYKLYVVFNQ